MSCSTTELSFINGSSTIANNTTACAVQLGLDLTNLAAADKFEICLREKVLSGGTQRQHTLGCVTGVQSPFWWSGTFLVLNGWDLTIKRLAGADATIGYSVRKAGPVYEYAANSATITNSERSLINNANASPASAADAGAYQLWVDVANIANGDTFGIYQREKVNSGGAQRIRVVDQICGNVGVQNPWVSDVEILLNAFDYGLKRLGGSDRTLSWSLRRAA